MKIKTHEDFDIDFEYVWKPRMIEGNDNVVHPVYKIFSGGRGWANFLSYTPVNKDVEIKVRVIGSHEYNGKHFLDVVICNAVEIPIYSFVKSPYKRKNGTSDPSIREYFKGATFAQVYGVYTFSPSAVYFNDVFNKTCKTVATVPFSFPCSFSTIAHNEKLIMCAPAMLKAKQQLSYGACQSSSLELE